MKNVAPLRKSVIETNERLKAQYGYDTYFLMYEREAPLSHKLLSVHLTEDDARTAQGQLTGQKRKYSYVTTASKQELEDFINKFFD